MADAKQKTVLRFGGGWATDLGPTYAGAAQQNVLTVPWLQQADNVLFELDGWPHKIGGTATASASAIQEGGANITITGLYEFYRQTGSEIHARMAAGGTQIFKEDLDDVWDSITTGLENERHPSFATFNDGVIIATDSNSDVPQRWNGNAATTANLGGSPPNFAFCVDHKQRVWAAGVASNPSRLYYSAAGNDEAWTGADTGSIDIDVNDGDKIVALYSHKNELFVFKGPNHGSIHRITGSSPSDFARVPFIVGIPAISHTSIVKVNDDLVFPSEYGIHSLAVTAAYGDYVEAFLSFPILSYYQGLSHDGFPTTWGCAYPARGVCLWSFPESGLTKGISLVYDYRFTPGRWSRWTSYYNARSLAVLKSNEGRRCLYAGGYDGQIHRLDLETRTIGGAGAYTATVRTPGLTFGSAAVLKTIEELYVSYVPVGTAGTMTVGLTRDYAAESTASLTMSGGDRLV